MDWPDGHIGIRCGRRMLISPARDRITAVDLDVRAGAGMVRGRIDEGRAVVNEVVRMLLVDVFLCMLDVDVGVGGLDVDVGGLGLVVAGPTVGAHRKPSQASLEGNEEDQEDG